MDLGDRSDRRIESWRDQRDEGSSRRTNPQQLMLETLRSEPDFSVCARVEGPGPFFLPWEWKPFADYNIFKGIAFHACDSSDVLFRTLKPMLGMLSSCESNSETSVSS